MSAFAKDTITFVVFLAVSCALSSAAEAASGRCDICHQIEASSFNLTAHSKDKACGTCHGDAARHMAEQEMPGNILNPAALSAKKANEACLNCHGEKGADVAEKFRSLPNLHDGVRCYECHIPHLKAKDGQAGLDAFRKDMSSDCGSCHRQRADEFRDSDHGIRAAIRCTECHKLHKSETISQYIEGEIEKCVSCHPDQELEFKKQFAHPLREVQIRCSSCHNPHSSRHKGMLKEDGDKTCGQCHEDIVIEAGKHPAGKNTNHPFKTVACVDCHNAHGSNFNNILKHDINTICRTCHS